MANPSPSSVTSRINAVSFTISNVSALDLPTSTAPKRTTGTAHGSLKIARRRSPARLGGLFPRFPVRLGAAGPPSRSLISSHRSGVTADSAAHIASLDVSSSAFVVVIVPPSALAPVVVGGLAGGGRVVFAPSRVVFAPVPSRPRRRRTRRHSATRVVLPRAFASRVTARSTRVEMCRLGPSTSRDRPIELVPPETRLEASSASTDECVTSARPSCGRDGAAATTATERQGKKSRGVARERDPVAYYSNKIDRWFDAHPIAGCLVSAMTVFAFLYGAYAVSVATGVYERYLAKRVEPILIERVAPATSRSSARCVGSRDRSIEAKWSVVPACARHSFLHSRATRRRWKNIQKHKI